MRKVVVTGGAGFIGSHVVDLFLQNQCEILVIDDLSTGRQENLDAAVKEYSCLRN
jgi:UDP-glucose 4-epimerase